MNRIHALTDLSAREAAEQMARGDLRTADYVDALLRRSAAADSLGGLLHQDAQRLRGEATALDTARRPAAGTRPLHGVPLAFKDNIDVVGFPTTAGSPWMADHRPRRAAGVTQRLLAAGEHHQRVGAGIGITCLRPERPALPPLAGVGDRVLVSDF